MFFSVSLKIAVELLVAAVFGRGKGMVAADHEKKEESLGKDLIGNTGSTDIVEQQAKPETIETRYSDTIDQVEVKPLVTKMMDSIELILETIESSDPNTIDEPENKPGVTEKMDSIESILETIESSDANTIDEAQNKPGDSEKIDSLESILETIESSDPNTIDEPENKPGVAEEMKPTGETLESSDPNTVDQTKTKSIVTETNESTDASLESLEPNIEDQMEVKTMAIEIIESTGATMEMYDSRDHNSVDQTEVKPMVKEMESTGATDEILKESEPNTVDQIGIKPMLEDQMKDIGDEVNDSRLGNAAVSNSNENVGEPHLESSPSPSVDPANEIGKPSEGYNLKKSSSEYDASEVPDVGEPSEEYGSESVEGTDPDRSLFKDDEEIGLPEDEVASKNIIHQRELEVKAYDAIIQQKEPEEKANDAAIQRAENELKANDVSIRHEEPKVKANDAVIPKEKPEVKANDVSIRHKEPKVKANDAKIPKEKPEVKANDVSIRHEEPKVKANDAKFPKEKPEVKANDVSIRHKEPKVKANDAVIQKERPEVKANDVSIEHEEPKVKANDAKIPKEKPEVKANDYIIEKEKPEKEIKANKALIHQEGKEGKVNDSIIPQEDLEVKANDSISKEKNVDWNEKFDQSPSLRFDISGGAQWLLWLICAIFCFPDVICGTVPYYACHTFDSVESLQLSNLSIWRNSLELCGRRARSSGKLFTCFSDAKAILVNSMTVKLYTKNDHPEDSFTLKCGQGHQTDSISSSGKDRLSATVVETLWETYRDEEPADTTIPLPTDTSMLSARQTLGGAHMHLGLYLALPCVLLCSAIYIYYIYQKHRKRAARRTQG